MSNSSAHFLRTWRASLPRPLAEMLVYAGSGKNHCLRLGSLALELWSADPKSLSANLVVDFLLCAFEEEPGDGALAAQILDISQRIAPLPPAKAELLRACAQNAPHASLLAWQDARQAWQEEDWEKALACYQKAGAAWLTAREQSGHCLVRMGRIDDALALWQHVLTLRPWRTELLLALHDHLEGLHNPLSGPPGPVAALLYTWNKADDLHQALHSLENSLEDLALVACLDNGSSDATPDILRAWKDRWGQRLLVTSIPVNVGAPAARNWLAHLPEVRALPFAAYIDDDALLPPDWLRHLAQSVRMHPQASAWGCRVVDAQAPDFMQSGPLHVWPNFRAADGTPPLPLHSLQTTPDTAADVAFSPMLAKAEPFRLTDFLCAGPDHGAHSYIRPCASVTGCCHLLRTEDLADHPFSLSFSPSQLDDVHRDLSLLHAGRLASYNGFCTVRHNKRSGQGQLLAAALGNTLGNRYKLYGQWEAQEAADMIRREFQELEADLGAKMELLEARMGL